ncbi:MAG: sigma-54-dependent Fis family transcriptional regulator [Chitinophagaceae bacterium]|nr:MAG: sigma-54-dependent Fis family transcriptional regulator [Chitinophagaceae bacterium]
MKSEEYSKVIFIVEDDTGYARMLKYLFEMNPEHEVHIFESGKECINNLHLNPLVITLDYSLPDMKGEDVLEKINKHDKDINVIILSGQKDISVAVNLVKQGGAYDYITKDSQTKDRLLNIINNIYKNSLLVKELEKARRELSDKYVFSNTIMGNSAPMKKVFDLLDKAVQTNINVTIYGETGTGKELVAKSIHYNSNQKKGPFVPVNVAAIPNELLESELFGHERGAFTGASSLRIGKFEEANNGTLFLDEIGEMDFSLQAKLLRAIQEREFSRIGSNKIIPFNTRFIVATNRDLKEEVKRGNFREDLYYRLMGLPVYLPPLRERGNDILLLAQFFLIEFCKQNNIDLPVISSKAKKKLLRYHYPGNVRELKAIIELAAVMINGKDIEPEDISFSEDHMVEDLLKEEMTMKEYSNRILNFYLKKYNGDIKKVAQKLEIGKSTIYRMLKEMDV